MKNFLKFAQITAICFVAFMIAGFLSNFAVQAWDSFFTAECDWFCRNAQIGHALEKFNAENPVLTFSIGALLVAMLIAGGVLAERQSSTEVEKPKNKPTAVLGDDGEWVHTDNPTPSGYLLPTYIKQRDVIQDQITTIKNTSWYPDKENALADLDRRLMEVTVKIQALRVQESHHDQA